MSPAVADLDQSITEAELDDLVEATLTEIGLDLDGLRHHAEIGRFESEKQRRAWFVIRGLGRG